jgi:hypothetical protein
MLRRVALVRTDVSEERSASFTRVTRIGEDVNIRGYRCDASYAQRVHTAVNFGFLDGILYFLIQVVPQLSSRG